ncbi:MAG: uracil-DNA glycosylase family protein [Gammaproteobacteria bacterium]
MSATLKELVREARACTRCAAQLPLGPRPVFQIDEAATILVAAQAPGTKVHASGRPFTDPSGDRLRAWMGIDEATFYDPRRLAIVPMGFCYPGRGRAGDLPPRPECAPAWRQPLLDRLPNIRLTLVIGQYARDWHLPAARGQTLTATVQRYKDYAPALMPLPHPSPRNNLWLKKNPWFERDVVPALARRVAVALSLRA